jgi:hypothetical protein
MTEPADPGDPNDPAGAPGPADAAGPVPEDFRLPEGDLDDLAASLARTIAAVRDYGVILDSLRDTPPNAPAPRPDDEDDDEGVPPSLFILALGGAAYAEELAALAAWVDHLLLPVYGREISATRPWCARWHEHPEAVARLHGLWLAWQQLIATDAGLTGPSTWHRDHLDHALLQLRAPDGPFAACTTNPARPAHRLLPTPGPTTEAP